MNKVIEAFSDIGMGVMVDRTRSKHGQVRLWFLRNGIPRRLASNARLVPSGQWLRLTVSGLQLLNPKQEIMKHSLVIRNG
ncbi:hypothetical protein [Paenibacillus sp. LPE1-1-1.1]|uniref:hypothetical protein n=1 Tax=Paenibacillus sp. LPE1-1-1.1 TaxID=3135230 RepID=UPI00343A1F70